MWLARVVSVESSLTSQKQRGCELQLPKCFAANLPDPQPYACGVLPPPEPSLSLCPPHACAEGRPLDAKMSGDDEQQEQTIAEDLVVTKYKMGGDIANSECPAVSRGDVALPGSGCQHMNAG